MKKKHTQTVVFHAVEKAATKRERVVCVCVCVCARARFLYCNVRGHHTVRRYSTNHCYCESFYSIVEIKFLAYGVNVTLFFLCILFYI